MARRFTVVLSDEDALALDRTSRAEGVTRAELIRRGVRQVTAAHRRAPKALMGWLRLSPAERGVLGQDATCDFDSGERAAASARAVRTRRAPAPRRRPPAPGRR